MIKSIITITCLVCVWGVHSFVHAQEVSDYKGMDVASFTLDIEGIKKATGEVRIAMFDSEQKYKKDPVYAVVVAVDSNTVSWTVPDLPFGKYAIAVYHDKNTNGKLDTNLLGIPKEQYGFSNNARGKFGPASWKDAHFVVESSECSHRIKIK